MNKIQTKEVKVKAWAVLVPGTNEPMSAMSSDVARGTRQYVLFCDYDAKNQAERASYPYPFDSRKIVEVTISYQKPINSKK